MNNVIERLAKDKVVEEIVGNVAKDTKDEDLKDLTQDIYMELMTKDEELIDKMYENNQIKFFITRMVVNNIMSSTSRFFYKYRKNKCNEVSIDDVNLSDLGSE